MGCGDLEFSTGPSGETSSSAVSRRSTAAESCAWTPLKSSSAEIGGNAYGIKLSGEKALDAAEADNGPPGDRIGGNVILSTCPKDLLLERMEPTGRALDTKGDNSAGERGDELLRMDGKARCNGGRDVDESWIAKDGMSTATGELPPPLISPLPLPSALPLVRDKELKLLRLILC